MCAPFAFFSTELELLFPLGRRSNWEEKFCNLCWPTISLLSFSPVFLNLGDPHRIPISESYLIIFIFISIFILCCLRHCVKGSQYEEGWEGGPHRLDRKKHKLLITFWGVKVGPWLYGRIVFSSEIRKASLQSESAQELPFFNLRKWGGILGGGQQDRSKGKEGRPGAYSGLLRLS